MNRSVTLIVKPTHACNLRCPYCYDKMNKTSKGVMSLDMVRKTAEIFRNFDKVTWIWHGGEPLLMGVEWLDNASAIVQDILGKDRVILALQTNGVLIDDKYIQFFHKYGITPGLSFDGIRNEFTRKNTKELLRAWSKLEQAGLNFGSILVFGKDHDLIAEYEFAKRLGLKLQMNPIFEAIENPDSYSLEAEKLAKVVCDLFDYWIRDRVNPQNSELCINYLNRLLGTGRTFCSNVDCVGKWFSIQNDGRIQPCGRDWLDDMTFGNVMDISSVEEITNHENFRRFRKRTAELLKKCEETCEFYSMCMGGCFGNVHHHNNDFSEPNPSDCGSTKIILKHIYNVIKDFDFDDYQEYNPIFVDYLLRNGLRTLSTIRNVIGVDN